MKTLFRKICAATLAVFCLAIASCSTYSGPGSSLKKSAVYEAQDNAFRKMAR